MLDRNKIKSDFPFLEQKINGKRIAFLDSAASAQKPRSVIDSMSDASYFNYANIHRAVYSLSENATNSYANTRSKVKDFINANKDNEIIFTKGATESINLVAHSLGELYFKEHDEIIISEMEHHANIIPWQVIAKKNNLKIVIWSLNANHELDIDDLKKLITLKTKMITVTHCSNLLGTINDVSAISKIAHDNGALVLVDGAQSIVHQKIDVKNIDCDFFVFSAHKMYGPTGVGVLYAKYEILEKMPPYQTGGDMIKDVTMHSSTFADPPHRFEAGTPNIVGVAGLSKSIDYITDIGYTDIQQNEKELSLLAIEGLESIDGLRIINKSKVKAGIIAFMIDGFHANDIGSLLDLHGVCVRTGQHCAQPLMDHLNLTSVLRVSFGVYNNSQDVHQLVDGLKKSIQMLR